ncbi:hypothetical protein KCU86_g68, partial [Aureobasidium melanogenum]
MWLRSAQRCQMVGDWTREARYFFGRSTCRCALLQCLMVNHAQKRTALSNSRWMDEGEQRGEREEEKQKGKA